MQFQNGTRALEVVQTATPGASSICPGVVSHITDSKEHSINNLGVFKVSNVFRPPTSRDGLGRAFIRASEEMGRLGLLSANPIRLVRSPFGVPRRDSE
jgi:hypothetical protein